MHDWLLATWYGGSSRGAWLLPFAWLFAAATGMRRWLYRRRLLAARRSARPVIVVGNITVGGTGKTPLIVWLARELGARGWRTGVVSRGYGGRAGTARRVSKSDPAELVGDEPALIARRCDAAVAVGADRAAAAGLLEAECDVILSDDGLQHYRMERDLEIAVVRGARGLGNGRLLPAGPLREAAGRLATVDAVVVNGTGFDWPGALRMRLEPLRFVGVATGATLPLTAFRGRRVHALAAIGEPQAFFSLLATLGIEVEPQPLPDHAVPTRAQLDCGGGSPVLMTEKDAVKCLAAAGPDHWYLEIGAAFDPADSARLLELVEAACRNRSP